MLEVALLAVGGTYSNKQCLVFANWFNISFPSMERQCVKLVCELNDCKPEGCQVQHAFCEKRPGRGLLRMGAALNEVVGP